MARFALDRDINFFRSISRELVDHVIENTVVLYKLVIEDTKTNLYGESLSKTYYQGLQTTGIPDRNDTEFNYEEFGPDGDQSVQFRFNRFTLEEKNFYPEIGDLVYHNDAYFEIDSVREDQLIGGRVDEKFSIVCSTFMTRRSTIQTEDRIK